MPEQQHAMGAAQKARSIDHVGTPVDQRFHHVAKIARVVFEVGVLHDYELVLRGRKTESERRALAAIHRVVEAMNFWMRELFEILARTVRRSVIDYHDFGLVAAIEHPPNYL